MKEVIRLFLQKQQFLILFLQIILEQQKNTLSIIQEIIMVVVVIANTLQ